MIPSMFVIVAGIGPAVGPGSCYSNSDALMIMLSLNRKPVKLARHDGVFGLQAVSLNHPLITFMHHVLCSGIFPHRLRISFRGPPCLKLDSLDPQSWYTLNPPTINNWLQIVEPYA